jgi:hypothetical protein
MLKPWGFVAALTVIACGARPVPVGEPLNGSGNPVTTTTGGTSGTASGGATGSGGSCGAPPASSLCSQNPTGPVAVHAEPDLLAAMVGRWVLCGRESVFAVDAGDVGLEITADHRWYKLYTAPGAATVRGAGFDEEGTWTALDLGDHFQVNFDIFGGGTVITAPVFASTPRAMRLDNNGVFRGNYVLDPTVPTGSVRCAAQADPTRSGACTPPGDTLMEQPCTDDVAIDRTLGRWSRCGGSMPGAPAHDGIELAANGSFYFLHRDPTAGLVRGTSDVDRGMAKVVVAAPCRADIDIETLGGASITSSTQLYQSTPRQLWIYTSPEWGDPERYTFVSP